MTTHDIRPERRTLHGAASMRLDVRRDFPTRTVTARTPTAWVTAGFCGDLDEATHEAVGAMLDLLEAMSGEPRVRCMALASAIVDLHVTQLVNDVRGVHALLPHALVDHADWRDI